MYVLSELERKDFPFVKLMHKTRIKGVLVVKLLKVRDLLSLWVPDLLYDAIISLSRLDSLEAGGMWNVEEYSNYPELLALYEVGKKATIKAGIKDIRARYEELIRGR